MTDNIIPGHIRILGISYNFWNTYNLHLYEYNIKKAWYYFLFNNASHTI